MIKKFSLLLTSFALVQSARAFVPEVGQVIRYQPMIWRHSKPYVDRGFVTSGRFKMETFLDWHGPGIYRLTIEGIPRSFYSSGDGSSEWILTRYGKRCVVKTESMTVGCPPAAAWGEMELSGQPEEVAATLVNAGIISEADAPYKETDGRETPKDPKEKNIHIGIISYGKLPSAVLEIQGPNYKSDVPDEEYPLLAYDQTFLSPVLLRFSRDGEVVTIRGLADLNMATRKTRNSAVLSNRVEVFADKVLRASFIRKDPVVSLKPGPAVSIPKTITDISSLRDQLSVEGQAFLKALLLTH